MTKLEAVDNAVVEQLTQEKKDFERKWAKEVEKTSAMQLEVARLKMLMEAIKSENDKRSTEIFNLKAEIARYDSYLTIPNPCSPFADLW